MNYFVISDIHGDATQLEKALALYKSGSYKALLILGDILYHGPRNDLPAGYNPKKVIDLLNPIADQIIAVKGNCDGEVDQMVLNFSILNADNTLFIEDKTLFMTHGHIHSKTVRFPLKEGSLFLSGHTHLPVAEKEENIYFLNPGSISIPKGGYQASFAILNEKEFTIYQLADQKIIKSIQF